MTKTTLPKDGKKLVPAKEDDNRAMPDADLEFSIAARRLLVAINCAI